MGQKIELIYLALPDVFSVCMRKDGGVRRRDCFKFLREHHLASTHAISLLISHTSRWAWQGIRPELPKMLLIFLVSASAIAVFMNLKVITL